MSSKRDSNNLNNSDNVSSLAKKTKLECKLISEKISQNHPDLMYMNMKFINFH